MVHTKQYTVVFANGEDDGTLLHIFETLNEDAKTVYSRFCKWRDDGTLLHIFETLNEDADFENLSIDSTSIKAHPQSAGAKKGQ